MNLETLRKVVYESCKYNGKEVKFFWHGGEPLLAGINFYKEAVKFQKEYQKSDQKIINGLQTNGTLIDKDWAKFFKKEKFGLGISLDGPKKYHDYYRHYSNGKGSFENIMEGIDILKEMGVGFSVISVITDRTAKVSRELFDFFMSQELTKKINFVPAKPVSTTDSISYKYSVNPSAYINFLGGILNLWFEKDSNGLKVYPLESIIRAFLGFSQEDCRFAGECEKSLVIDYNGDVFACSTYGYGDFFKFGNIQKGIISIINSKEFQNYRKYLNQIKEKCSKCQWFKICKGGCPHDHYLGKEENIFCPDFKRLFEHIRKALEKYQLLSHE